MTKKIILLTALLTAASSWAGDLTVDNLTVSEDANIYGTLNIGGTITAGGIITINGGYRIHTFTASGTFKVFGGSATCDVLVVAGGGGGGYWDGGGGGAGGLVYTSNYVVGIGSYTVIVGAAGAKAITGGLAENGGNSAFGTIEAIGGGGGSGNGAGYMDGANGGSGGGALGGSYNLGGGGTAGQGNSGGNGFSAGEAYGAGGGGGAGAIGGNGTSTNGGNGGVGLQYSQFASVGGNPAGWFSGGGGGAVNNTTTTPGTGGNGGGGAGSKAGVVPTAGAVNTGGGGGGGGGNAGGTQQNGANGGSGIVIVRYPIGGSISNIFTLTISSNGISQTSVAGSNVFMGKVGIGANNPAEQLHVVGNARVDGTNIVAAITLGNETRTNWPNVAVGALIASNNLADVANTASARANLGLGTAATNDASAFDPAGAAGAVSDTLSAHTANLNNPHQVTASQVGALSTTGGVVNGSLEITGSIAVGAPGGDIPMGVFINR